MINLLTTYYNTNSNSRKHELDMCINNNINNPYINTITILDESNKFENDSNKINIIRVNKRPTYEDFISYANAVFVDDIIMIANTDIYFDDSLALIHSINFNTHAMILTRYNVNGDLCELQGGNSRPNFGSSDVWAFKTPIRAIKNSDITIGIMGCDSYFVQNIFMSGFVVINPCFSIKAYHMHLINERNDSINGWTYWTKEDYCGRSVKGCRL